MTRVFYAMPFTGKGHAEIVRARERLHELARTHGVHLLEQFIGVERESLYERHAYGPLFVVGKDHDLLRQADVVIADYAQPSVGRDCEVVAAKDTYDKRVIAVVPDAHARNHPWVRFYADYVVGSPEDAFALAASLSSLSLSAAMSAPSREQKDALDAQLRRRRRHAGAASLLPLLPTELVRRWRDLFGDAFDDVIDSVAKRPAKTLRANPLKGGVTRLREIAAREGWILSPVACVENAFRLPPDAVPHFGSIPAYQDGAFYVQDLASLLPAAALAPRPGERVLDVAAAPGSKTTQLAELVGATGSVFANDVSAERLAVLREALARLGISNVRVHHGDGAALGHEMPDVFDKVLVDAPCSGEGILGYKPHTLFAWNLPTVRSLTKTQAELLASGFRALKPGGVLVYATCTFAPEENEAIIDAFLRTHPNAAIVPVSLPGIIVRPGLASWEHRAFDPSLIHAVRVLPHENDSIGFFLVKIQKRA